MAKKGKKKQHKKKQRGLMPVLPFMAMPMQALGIWPLGQLDAGTASPASFLQAIQQAGDSQYVAAGDNGDIDSHANCPYRNDGPILHDFKHLCEDLNNFSDNLAGMARKTGAGMDLAHDLQTLADDWRAWLHDGIERFASRVSRVALAARVEEENDDLDPSTN